MALIEWVETDFVGSGIFGPDIDGAGGITADQHGGEPRHDIIAGSKPRGFLCDARSEAQRNRLAVDDLGAHSVVPRTESSDGLHSASIILIRDVAPDTMRTLDV